MTEGLETENTGNDAGKRFGGKGVTSAPLEKRGNGFWEESEFKLPKKGIQTLLKIDTRGERRRKPT